MGERADRGQARVPDAQAGVPRASGQRAALGQPLHTAHPASHAALVRAALVHAHYHLRPRKEIVPGRPTRSLTDPCPAQLCMQQTDGNAMLARSCLP